MKTSLPVLMYHSIRKPGRREIMKGMHVKPSSLGWQMRLLSKLGFKGTSLREALQLKQMDPSAKVVALTFDDGYFNFFSDALPILVSHKFSATVYVPTARIGQTNLWDENKGIHMQSLMTKEHLQKCICENIEIGCHSMTHSDLTHTSSDLSIEIYKAKSELDLSLGTETSSFCYPFGLYNQEVMNILKRAGFTNAVTMRRGLFSGEDDIFQIPRVPITWHTMPHAYLLKLLTSYEDKRRRQ